MKRKTKVFYKKLGREGAYGQCEIDPQAPMMQIDYRAHPRKVMETIIHEQLHLSADDYLNEKLITRVAKEISYVLWDENYRQVILKKQFIPVK